jgi:hypothetical protein
MLLGSWGVVWLLWGRWLGRQRGDDPWWQGISRDAIRVQPLQRPCQAV